MNPAIVYAIDAIIAIILAKLRSDADPAFRDLIDRVRSIVQDDRDPDVGDEEALEAFILTERDKLHN